MKEEKMRSMMRTGNPTLTANTFTRVGVSDNAMTIQGTVNKTMLSLLLLVITASWVWEKTMTTGMIPPVAILGSFVAFAVAIVTVFKKEWSPVTAPVYAGLKGLLVGGLSAYFEKQFPGIVMQAVALTFGTLFSLLVAYRSGLIKPTENFKLGIFAATGGICVIYLVSMVLGFFGKSVPMIHSSGPVGILFSLFVVVIAALNLVLDFDFIEQGAERGAPKYMEWYASFGLMVTLIWLYIEILRLLAKLYSRRH